MELKNEIILYFNLLSKNDRSYNQEEFTKIRQQTTADGGVYEWTLLDKLNGKVYRRDYIRSERRLSDVKTPIESPIVCGELGHPDNFDITFKNISHVIENVKIDNQYLVADIKVLDTNKGKELKSLIEQGTDIVFRPRLTGTINENKEVEIDALFTFDAILKSEDAFNLGNNG